jgi:hypothetical protein
MDRPSLPRQRARAGHRRCPAIAGRASTAPLQVNMSAPYFPHNILDRAPVLALQPGNLGQCSLARAIDASKLLPQTPPRRPLPGWDEHEADSDQKHRQAVEDADDLDLAVPAANQKRDPPGMNNQGVTWPKKATSNARTTA